MDPSDAHDREFYQPFPLSGKRCRFTTTAIRHGFIRPCDLVTGVGRFTGQIAGRATGPIARRRAFGSPLHCQHAD